ncbi:MAG: MATE family efflux transporter [Lachnospiraceae bacterium]|nr:MATE family efflux transporter [Lachnospiraceae bacterium]
MYKHDNALNREWSMASLLKFAFPTIFMMVFMGLYTIVDTIFVAQFVNTDALSAINIVCPVVNITVGLGTMIATGGNAIVSRKMGAGKNNEAREDFTLLVITAAVVGLIILITGIIWIDHIVYALGSGSLLFPYCKDYLRVLFLFIPANMVQTVLANLFVTAGKPGLGFGLSLLSGLANIILDYVFIVICRLGICGAALGTGFGYLIPAVFGTVFFLRHEGSLSFTRPRWKWKVLKEACLNGSSEMVGQLAGAVTTFLFNASMMDLLGEDGVAAITIMIYSQFLLNTLYIGFSMGVAPIVGFNHGSKNHLRQRKIFRICMGFIAAASLLVFTVSMFGGPYIIGLYVAPTSKIYGVATEGFSIFSCSFLFCGLNIFTSAMFTALSNGKLSAVLSFLRTFGLLSGGILFLPKLFGIAGIWLAVPVAEGIMFFVSVLCLVHFVHNSLKIS